RDRDHYFEHDPGGNIDAVGQYKKSIASIAELIGLYRSGAVPPAAMLTFSCNIGPSAISTPSRRAAVADTVIAPLVAWRDSGRVVVTDFTSLINTWETVYGGQGYLYRETQNVGVMSAIPPLAILALAPAAPNPIRTSALMRYSLGREAHVRLAIFDIAGRQVAVLVDEPQAAGDHAVRWDAGRVLNGAYLGRLEEVRADGDHGGSKVTRKLLILR
ncbi:MAG: hypothetical protein ABIS67_09040, partial [Candidatus Eisenbacteria bacterium]